MSSGSIESGNCIINKDHHGLVSGEGREGK